MSAPASPPALDTATAAAIEGARLPRRFGSFYVAEHQLRAMAGYKWTVIMTGIGTPLAYLLGIGLGLATLLDQSVAVGESGPVPYVMFVAPALLVAAAVGVTTEEFTYTVMAGFKWRRVFWGINASPVEPRQIASGLVFAVVVRLLFGTFAYYLLMLAFGAVGDPLRGAAIPLVGVLGALGFGLPLLAFSASLKDDTGQFAMVQRFVFTPMFLFSGTFYPLDTLPTWLQPIGWISPIWHASELGRVLSYGAPTPGWLVAVHVAVLVTLAVAGWLVARRIFTRRLR